MPKRRTVHAGGGGGVRKAAKRLRARYLGALALTALAVVTTMFALPSAARAALADHTVSGVSPRGTTINLFDYWITGQSDSDQSNPDNYQNLGINAGSVLKFGAGMGNGSATSSLNGTTVNQWTQSAEPRTGIVTDELGEDGYPVLSQSLGGGSLSYLFSSEAAEGKAAYTDVDGLLQVDDQGYYYYNSQKNFAQFSADGNGSGDFTLYDRWGVRAGGNSPDGQFFPFNTGSDVFEDDGDQLAERNVRDGQVWNADEGVYGSWNYNHIVFTPNAILSTDAPINHYFGLSMSTRFVQQDGGRTAPEGTAGSQAVTYNFSGDDDVWIYIDGVLVGDLGGIHDATSIQINFETGDVVVYRDGDNDNQYDDGETVYEDTTLKAIFTAAGVAGQYAWSGDTFDDETYHTLDFFYLERGNTDSNMSLKYNLVNIPESGVVKVDQAGTAMAGVQFTLHQADENYDIVQGGMTISATTDANGEMVFTTKNSSGQELPITLGQLNDEGGNYWVLTEDGVPEGYRSAGDMHLRFENGLLLASNEWDTGAWSQPHVTVTAPTTVREYGDHSATHDSSDGVMFAVVFQKGDNGDWYPVSGDAFGGWTVADGNTTADIVAAAKENQYQFLLGSGGAYEVTIEDLPGDITTYEYVLKNSPDGNEDGALYNVQYYWADADAINDIDTSTNVVRIDADETDGYEGMDRVFSVTLNVPNIKNELTLVKTDDEGNALAGAAFTLYNDLNGNGTYDAGTDTIANDHLVTDDSGTLEVADANGLLPVGTYVLVETGAPADYMLEQTPIQIVVDGDGVHVDAGTATDNVTVETGIGSLVYSMKGFAAGDEVDATLHDVKAQAQTANAYDGSGTAWTNATAAETHYRYNGSNDKDLSYVRNDSVTGNGDATYTAEAGWSRLNIVQCRDHEGDLANGPKEDLGTTQSLNALFTGAVTIHVTNSKVPTTSSLTVSKTVTGTGAPESASFDFSLQFTDGSVTGPLTATVTDADGTETEETLTATDGSFTFSLKNGEKIEIGSLPIGVAYEVTESPSAHYAQSATLAGAAVSDDDLSNGLNVSGTISQTAAGNSVAFTNEFTGGSVEYSTAQAVNVSKVLNGRDMAENEFTIQVIPADDASAELLGLESKDDVLEVPMDAANDGQKVASDMFGGKGIVFTSDDAGIYRFTVSEEQAAENPSEGVTYDTAVYDLTIEVTVDGDGVVKAVTTATDNADYTSSQTVLGGSTAAGSVEIPFVNTYEATGQLGGDGSVAIEAHKTLENKELAGDDFTFTVSAVNANGIKRADATAKNDAEGDITFPAIEYTTDSLADDVASGYATQGVDENGNDTYTYTYEVAEDTSGFGSAGLSTAQASYTVKVTVTDDGDGTLGVDVAYPEGSADGLEFVNEYGAGASAKLAVGGTKVYEENGLENAPSIEGKYTFTLTGEDGAPLPKNTTATNSNGSFSFGDIEFGIEDLGGAASKTFTYTVSEGKTVEGVQNDAVSSKTFEVTLTDDGDGTISIDSVAQQAAGNQVSFTNTYSADPTDPSNPTGSDDPALTITKTLTGRALREGEFSFTMATASDYGDAVSPSSISAANTLNEDGTGSVVFSDGFTFSKPGYYEFTIKEDASSLGGVTTDTAAYQATAHVTDNGSGKLVVDSWKITDADGREVSQVTFENTYEASSSAPVYLSVSKELDGGELADGQFTFELTGSDGAPLPDATEATNDADGTVSFGAITFDEAGEYDYTVTEVDDGQDGISYDADATRTIHVSVTDNGEGSLVAEVSYGQDGSVFVNSVIPTGDGESPADDAGSDSGLPGTGDHMLAGAIAVLAAGAAAVAVGRIIQIRRRG